MKFLGKLANFFPKRINSCNQRTCLNVDFAQPPYVCILDIWKVHLREEYKERKGYIHLHSRVLAQLAPELVQICVLDNQALDISIFHFAFELQAEDLLRGECVA